MLQGKVHAALRLLDKAASLGVAPLSAETMKTLADLHPQAEPAIESVLQQGKSPILIQWYSLISMKSLLQMQLWKLAGQQDRLDLMRMVGREFERKLWYHWQTLCQTLSASPDRSSSIDTYTYVPAKKQAAKHMPCASSSMKKKKMRYCWSMHQMHLTL